MRLVAPVQTAALIAGGVCTALLISIDAPLAQQSPRHLNPVVQKLTEGKRVLGVSTHDVSLNNAGAPIYGRSTLRATFSAFR